MAIFSAVGGQILARDISGNVVNVSSTFSTTKAYEVGYLVTDQSGNEYAYAMTAANQAITQYDACGLWTAGAAPLTTTNAANGTGGGAPVGIAQAAATAGGSGVYKYGFFLVRTGAGKTASLRVAASCAAYTGLQTTATAGVIDDATGGVDIYGLVLSTAQGSAAGTNTTAIVSTPFLICTFA